MDFFGALLLFFSGTFPGIRTSYILSTDVEYEKWPELSRNLLKFAPVLATIIGIMMT